MGLVAAYGFAFYMAARIGAVLLALWLFNSDLFFADDSIYNPLPPHWMLLYFPSWCVVTVMCAWLLHYGIVLWTVPDDPNWITSEGEKEHLGI